MFRALLSHPQEALNKRHLVYSVRVISIGCYQVWSGTEFHSLKGSLRGDVFISRSGLKG
jgi:hypothetical protein